MKKTLSVTVEDADLVEFCRVLVDRDPDGALAFLEGHVRGKALDLLEGS